MKRSVIERLRAAQRYLHANGGAPLQWLHDLVSDAIQELESESGALWMQWQTPSGQVRLFVTGEMGPDDLDSLLDVLNLSRSFMAKREAAKQASVRIHDDPALTGEAPASDDAVPNPPDNPRLTPRVSSDSSSACGEPPAEKGTR